MTDLLELPTHPDTGLSALAVLAGRPVWPVLGGATDDEDDDDLGLDVTGGGKAGGKADPDEEDEDLDEDDGQDDGDKSKEDDWKPPSRDEFERMQKALTETNAEAKRYRLRVRELRRDARTAERTADKSGAADDEVAARAKQDAADEAERKYKPIAVKSAARAALLAAGLNDGSDGVMRKLLRLVDMEDVDLDEDGEVVGLDDQIDDIKDTFPKLFEKAEIEQPQKPGRPKVARINGANKQGGAPEPKTTGEKHMARLGLR
jgi:hypothetical protein